MHLYASTTVIQGK